MYSSARVRSLENRIATGERLLHLADAEGTAAVVSALSDFGFEIVRDENGGLCREDTLATVLIEGWREAEIMIEGEDILDFLRYSYDCHNLKAIIKCFFRGVSHKDMTIPLGSVDVGALEEAFEENNYSCLPKNMAEAAVKAKEVFATTGNPQKVDLIIDRACFADMLENSEKNGIALAVKMVKAKIDMTNLLTAVRLSLMDLKENALPVFTEAFIEGGNIDELFVTDSFSGIVGKINDKLEYSEYSALCPFLSGKIDLSVLERETDNVIMRIAKEARFVPFGPEILIGYVAALEYEVKNIRMILAGKDACLSSEVIRERLRESYV